MALDSGRGEVVDRPRLIYSLTTEKLAAVTQADDSTFWILSHEWYSDAFRAYPLTATGVGLTPVISHVGQVHGRDPDPTHLLVPGANAIGGMVISPDGKHVAIAVLASSFAEVFDFDRRTGVVSNPAFLPLPIVGSVGSAGCYGVAFSPNSQRLYVTRYLPTRRTDLHQFTLSGPRAGVAATAVALPGVGSALQLGLDGKLYGIGPLDPALSVVARPDAAGVDCGVRLNAIPLQLPQSGSLGLPNFLVRVVEPAPVPPGLAGLLPNILTPNADGLNDALQPARLLPVGAGGELRVFSRWGQLVFATTDLAAGWPAAGATGTYFYDLRLTVPAGAGSRPTVRGWVEVVR